MEELRGEKVTENIYRCPDGKYRWAYEFPMLKNPSILLTIWKIFGVLCLGWILLTFLINLFEGDMQGWLFDFLLTPGVLIVPGILLGLSLIGYLIVAARYGWKYMVLFEMDEQGIVHRQMPAQYQKAEAMGWLGAMAGLAAGSFTVAGASLLSASKDSSVTEFGKVKKIIGRKRLQLIKLNELLEHNQIYAGGEDWDFVWQYITQRCTDAKIR